MSLHVIDLLADEHVFSPEFETMTREDQALLMIEALINAGYRMKTVPSKANSAKWRALVKKWRNVGSGQCADGDVNGRAG